MNHEFASLPFNSQPLDHDERASSSYLLDELALHGYRPFEDEPDPRPLPSSDAATLALESVVEAFSGLFADTRLEADLPNLLWSFVNLFHRKAERIGRDLDDNETAQRRSHAKQDGSEIRSVALERLIAQGLTLTERRNAFEFFRDHLCKLYAAETGSSWRPRAGSLVNHRALTSAMIDSRDFLNARKLADAQVLMPPGPCIAFAGGPDCNGHVCVWAMLDKARAKHPDMVLLHDAGPKGAERIAAYWADNREITQVAFKPDWTRHKNAAPFKRNDAILEAHRSASSFSPVPASSAVWKGRRVSAVLRCRDQALDALGGRVEGNSGLQSRYEASVAPSGIRQRRYLDVDRACWELPTGFFTKPVNFC